MARGDTAPDNEDLARWLARVALGDRRAFEQLYRATCSYLMAVAWRVLQRRQLAEEVLQDSFVKVWHSAGAYDARLGVPMTWLINIVRNRAIDVRRARATAAVDDSVDAGDEAQDAPDAEGSHAAGPEQWLDTAIRKARVEGCMGQLSASQRQALALAYYQGLTHAEIAQVLQPAPHPGLRGAERGVEHLRDLRVREAL